MVTLNHVLSMLLVSFVPTIQTHCRIEKGFAILTNDPGIRQADFSATYDTNFQGVGDIRGQFRARFESGAVHGSFLPAPLAGRNQAGIHVDAPLMPSRIAKTDTQAVIWEGGNVNLKPEEATLDAMAMLGSRLVSLQKGLSLSFYYRNGEENAQGRVLFQELQNSSATILISSTIRKAAQPLWSITEWLTFDTKTGLLQRARISGLGASNKTVPAPYVSLQIVRREAKF